MQEKLENQLYYAREVGKPAATGFCAKALPGIKDLLPERFKIVEEFWEQKSIWGGEGRECIQNMKNREHGNRETFRLQYFI